MTVVLSVFDGKSCAQTCCEMAGINISKYYSAEIDPVAIKASNLLYPDQARLGDITKWREWDIDFSSINLLMGGFPCQAWSIAGKQQGDKDPRGKLFWDMLELFTYVQSKNPDVKFLIENVKMKGEFEEYITYHTEKYLGTVFKTFVNSNTLSAQNRPRYYWTSDPIDELAACKTELKDILCDDDRSDLYIDSSKWVGTSVETTIEAGIRGVAFTERRTEEAKRIRREYMARYGKDYSPRRGKELVARVDGKMNCLTATHSIKEHTVVDNRGNYRKLSAKEWLLLQTAPDYVIDTLLESSLSEAQIRKLAGNGWTYEVVTQLLKEMFK